MQFLFNKILSSIFSLLLLCILSNIYAQGYDLKIDTIITNKTTNIKIVTVRSVPRFILELSGSYNAGALELSAHNGGFSVSDFRLGKSYCARNGFGISLTGKMPLTKKGDFWIEAITGFTKFQSTLIVKNDEEGSVYYNSINGGVGAEYDFTSFHKVKYYVGANMLVSAISGQAQNLLNSDSTKTNVNISSSIRIGYTLFIGLGYAFDKSVGINMGLRFTHANLLLKQTQTPTNSNTATILNDSPTPADNHILYSGWKQFAYASAYLGLSYYFGVKETRYKLP